MLCKGFFSFYVKFREETDGSFSVQETLDMFVHDRLKPVCDVKTAEHCSDKENLP